MRVHQKDALNIHACASPDHYFVCLAFARSPKKIRIMANHFGKDGQHFCQFLDGFTRAGHFIEAFAGHSLFEGGQGVSL